MIKRSTKQWHTLFAEQAKSGLSAASFCRERHLCPKYFSLRRKQLLGEKPSSGKQPAAFVQVRPSVSTGKLTSCVRLRYRAVELSF